MEDCSGCEESLELFQTSEGWYCENCISIIERDLEEEDDIYKTLNYWRI